MDGCVDIGRGAGRVCGCGTAGGVSIWTSPETQALLVIDDVEVGLFPLYDGAKYIHVSWEPYAFPAGVNGSYHISVFQNYNPLGEPDWVEIKVNHHHADNPAGTEYDLGPFVPSDNLCEWCPSLIVVQPEVFVYDDQGGSSPYQYTLLNASYSTDALAALEQSEEILISGVKEAEPENVCVPIDTYEQDCSLGSGDDDCDGLDDSADSDCT